MPSFQRNFPKGLLDLIFVNMTWFLESQQIGKKASSAQVPSPTQTKNSIKSCNEELPEPILSKKKIIKAFLLYKKEVQNVFLAIRR